MRYDVGGFVDAAWSPDETRVAVSSKDGILKLFPAWRTTQELVDYARARCAVRALTDAERELFGLPVR